MTILLLALLSALTLRQEVGVAGDYTNQTYGIIDPDTLRNPDEWDTLDIETEARGFWNLDLDLDAGPTRFFAGNDFTLSTGSVREALALAFSRDLLPNLEIEIRNDAELSYYHRALPQLADTGFQSDYWSNTSNLALDFDVTPTLALSASDQFQLFHYPQPDSYSFDHRLNRVRAGLRQELGGVSSLGLEYDWTRRWAVDDQNYAEQGLDADFQWYFDAGPSLVLENSVVRRGYASAGRSYWEEAPGLRFDLDLSPAFDVSLEDEARWTWYDSPTSVYTNLIENSTRLDIEWRATPDLSLRVGPQYDLGRGLPAATSDDYREVSATIGIDYMRMDRLWLSVEDRLGQRRYPLADSSFQSNYVFNEFSLMANWTILKTAGGGLFLNTMVSIWPEWHTDRSSDLATRIFSLELKYGL